MSDKTIIVLDIIITSIVLNNHMVVTQVQIGINTIDDVFLGSYKIDNPLIGVTRVIFMGGYL
jgi:hypothetical protein